jgi:carbonic anhydrase/acetyltransferase-like protein (isoleucine patch superfamily)
MSVPSSLKVGPHTSNVLVKKRYLGFYILLIWISAFTIQFEFWVFWQFFIQNPTYMFYFIPIVGIIMYFSLVLVSLFAAKLLLIIVNKIHEPKEGVFLRDISDKNYRYWCIRNVIKKWPIWLAHKFPFPFLDNLCFKLFGVKTKFSNSLFEGWVDCEFIEFGDNVVIGQASLIQSSIIMGNLFIIKKTVIEDNVHIGAHTVVMPGTYIGENAILAANSLTTVGQDLEGGWIHLGVPTKKYKKNRFYENGLQQKLEQHIEDVSELRKGYEMLYTKRHDKDLSVLEKYKYMKKLKEEEERRLRVGKPEKG